MTYTPKPGSKAEAMVEALRHVEWLTTEQLARAGNARNAHVHGLMATAIKHGAVEKDGSAGQLRWCLGKSRSPSAMDVSSQWPFPLSAAAPAAQREQATAPEAPACNENPPDDSFACALWSDGELDIFGALEIEQNGVPGIRVTPEQVGHLRRLLIGSQPRV